MTDIQKADFGSLRSLHTILFLLTGVAGSTDAIGYFKLGEVFTANMTGNTVLLGIALGLREPEAAVRAFTALIAFVAGVAIGAVIIKRRKKDWRATLSYSLFIEFFLILIMCLLWWKFMAVCHSFVVIASIILSAIAMGLQSVTVRHLDIPGVVTTYITGTITVIVNEAVKNSGSIFHHILYPSKEAAAPVRLEQRIGLQILIFFSYLATAAVTTLIYLWGLNFLPLLPLILILSTIIIVMRTA